MEEIKKTNQYLIDYFKGLINSKQIFDAVNIDIKVQTSSDYRHKENDNYEKKFNPSLCTIEAVVYIKKGMGGTFIRTASHDNFFKCIKEVEFRVENELKLQQAMAAFKQKLETEIVDELSFKKDEFKKAIDNEEYENAERLKKEIEKLEKKQKSSKKK